MGSPEATGCARIKHMFAPVKKCALALVLLGAIAVSGPAETVSQ